MSATNSRTCDSCMNVTLGSEIRAAPCGHRYCRACLKRMARLSLKDKALIPLRCCRIELSVECVEFAFTQLAKESDFQRYQRYEADYRKAWQTSELVSDADYTKTVASVGAKQCPGCGVGVIRDFGCVHMKCPSGHEFCFTCLRRWRTCHCPRIPDDEVRRILGEE